MTSMIERVARALNPSLWEWYDRNRAGQRFTGPMIDSIESARAAIEAMREPTPRMYCAGDVAILKRLNSEKIITGEDTPAVGSWTAMIDAALTGKE